MMKTFFGVLLLIFVGSNTFSQTTIFNETCGTTASTTAIASFSGWVNNSFSFSGTADVRNTLPSSGYPGASANANVFIASTSGTYFEISGINTIGYTSISLKFGAYKSTTTSNMSDLVLEYTIDGVTYNTLSFPAQPTGSGTAVWSSIVVTTAVPSAESLKLRWTNTGTATQYRIDDIVLSGTPPINTITAVSATPSNYLLANCFVTGNGSLDFSSTSIFNSGNSYKVQLSNASGSFSQAINLGSISSTANSGTIPLTIPAGLAGGAGYLLRIVSTSPAVISNTYSITITQNGTCVTNNSDYFRSYQSGNWTDLNTWQSSTDNTNWITATSYPTSNANTITIGSGHTVTINAAVSADQLTINSGGILNHPAANTFTLNDRASETDMFIYGTYVIYGSVPAGSGTYNVENGGIIKANANSGGTADNIAWSSNTRVLFKTGSVFEWNTSLAFNTSGITFFPATTEKPIFRVSSSVGPIGGASNTTINGLLEVNGTLRLENAGVKLFRDGIIGTGTLVQEANSGAFQITGNDAQLGGTGTITLNTNGLQVTSGANVTMSSNKTINGSSFDFTVTNGGRFNCSTYVLSGTADFILADGGTLGIGSPDGITTSAAGNIQTTTRTYSSAANYLYNGSSNQVTGNFITTPTSATVNALTVANTGTSGNNTVTLTINNTTAASLYLNNGLFASGASQTLRIANGGNIYGNGGNNPNATNAGNIEFIGNGTSQGFSMGNPYLYSVILNGSIDFNGVTTHSATIMNRLQLNTGSTVTDAPFYQSGSSLVYNINGIYNRNIEWNSLSNQGYPHHVIVQGNTILNLNTNTISPARLEIAGDLIIGNSNGKGEVYLNSGMSKPLSVLANLAIGSTDAAANGSVLELSSVTGGDLWLNGNFTRYTNGSYNDGGRATYFKGSINSTVNTPNIAIAAGIPTQLFNNIVMEKNAVSNQLILNCPVAINGQLTLTTGVITTSPTNLLVIETAATSSAGSVTSFVNGPVRKKGGAAFTFPTGAIVGSEYHHRTIGITASGNDASSYTAKFIRSSANLLGPISSVAKANGLQRVSRCEYWSLVKDAGSDVGVTLTWTSQSPCNAAYVTSPATIVAAQFNGTQWGDLFGGSGTGSVTSGSVTWTGGPNVYNYFSLGSTDFLENPLPLELSNFKATARKQDIVLDWMTNTNNEQVEFVIEKSRNGVTFEKLQTVMAKALAVTAAYGEIDNKPFNGWNYYRLKAIDKLGKQQLSPIVKVWFGAGQQIRVSPNPASEKIMISFSEPSSISEIDVVNISGQVLKRITAVQFNNEINISHLQAGMYYVRITGKNGLTTTSFIKQ